jgi:hypothetical protein
MRNDFGNYGRYDTEGHRDESLSATIERHAKHTKSLADEIGEKVAEISERHKFLLGLQELQADHSIPIKTLEKRLALLTAINERQRYIADANLSNEKLKERVELIETTLRLEPDQANRVPLKSLKERARILAAIENGLTEAQWQDIEKRAQAAKREMLEAVKAETKARVVRNLPATVDELNQMRVANAVAVNGVADTAGDHFFDPAE